MTRNMMPLVKRIPKESQISKAIFLSLCTYIKTKSIKSDVFIN